MLKKFVEALSFVFLGKEVSSEEHTIDSFQMVKIISKKKVYGFDVGQVLYASREFAAGGC